MNENFGVPQRVITRSLNALVMVAPFAFLKGRTSIHRPVERGHSDAGRTRVYKDP